MYRRPVVYKQVPIKEVRHYIVGQDSGTPSEKSTPDNPFICVCINPNHSLREILNISHDFIYYTHNGVITSGCVSAPTSLDTLFEEAIVSIPDIGPHEFTIGSSIIDYTKMTYDDIHNASYLIKDKLFEIRLDKYIEYELIIRSSNNSVETYIAYASEDSLEELYIRHRYLEKLKYKGLNILYEPGGPLRRTIIIHIDDWLKRNNITWRPPVAKHKTPTQWEMTKLISAQGKKITPYRDIISAATEYWHRAIKYKNARIFPSRMFPKENTGQLYDFSAYTTLTSLPVYLQDEEEDASIPDFIHPRLQFRSPVPVKYIDMACAFLDDVSKLKNIYPLLGLRWRYVVYSDYALFRCWYMELVYGRKFKYNYAPLVPREEISSLENLKNPIFFRPAPLLTRKDCKTLRIGLNDRHTIAQRFDKFTQKLFVKDNLYKLHFVGSIIDYCCIKGAEDYEDQYVDSDIDIMCNDIDHYVSYLYDKLSRFNPECVVKKIYLKNSTRYKYRFTMANYRTIELFSANKMQVIGYHVPAVRGVITLSESSIVHSYLTPSFICTAATGIIPEYRWVKVANGAKNIIMKYIKRGYRFMASPLEVEELKDENLVIEDFPDDLVKYSIIDSNGNVIHPCDKGLW